MNMYFMYLYIYVYVHHNVEKIIRILKRKKVIYFEVNEQKIKCRRKIKIKEKEKLTST